VDDKTKAINEIIRNNVLPPIATNTPTMQVGVPMSQIYSQPGLVTHPRLISQNLS
jgi:hypothetical protein